jgi:6-phosphofructokinase
MRKRFGILTSGGDCQSLNATMRGIGKTINRMYDNVQIFGFEEGYRGLMYEDYRILGEDDFSGLLSRGGTILGTSRTPFKQIHEPDENGSDKVSMMKQTYNKLALDGLFVLGGNGSIKTANLLSEEGLNVLAAPKTIDNDLWGTDVTFGFQSALSIATNAIDCIHTTAASHRRVFIVEIMGHKVGWLTLYAGIAGGADIILLPEIPYNIESICRAIEERSKEGKHFTILAVAEGAISQEKAKLSKKELKGLAKAGTSYPSVAYEIGAAIEARTGKEIRVTVPGHMQRGGVPTAYDRVLATRLGVETARLAYEGSFGYMTGMKNNEIVKVPLSDVAGKLKTVDPGCQEILEARALGISFGDEQVPAEK